MKSYALPIILASTLLAQAASAQTSSSTPVIGYYRQTLQPGNTPVVAGFTTKKDHQSAMTSTVSGTPNSDINQTGATWTVNQFQTSASPATNSSHFLEILSGTNAGMIFDIFSNDADTITVVGNTSGLAGTETFCVRKHVTLGTLFPPATTELVSGSDTVIIVNSDGSAEEFAHNGGNWEDVGSLDDGTNKTIYPGQGFIIHRGGATPVTVTVGGNDVSYVKPGPTMVPLYAGPSTNPVRNYVGLVNPLVSDDANNSDFNTLGNFGLVAALNPGSDTVDHISLNGAFTTIATYVSNGGNLEDVGSLEDGTNVKIRNGSSFRVIVPGTVDRVTKMPQTHPN